MTGLGLLPSVGRDSAITARAGLGAFGVPSAAHAEGRHYWELALEKAPEDGEVEVTEDARAPSRVEVDLALRPTGLPSADGDAYAAYMSAVAGEAAVALGSSAPPTDALSTDSVPRLVPRLVPAALKVWIDCNQAFIKRSSSVHQVVIKR